MVQSSRIRNKQGTGAWGGTGVAKNRLRVRVDHKAPITIQDGFFIHLLRLEMETMKMTIFSWWHRSKSYYEVV